MGGEKGTFCVQCLATRYRLFRNDTKEGIRPNISRNTGKGSFKEVTLRWYPKILYSGSPNFTYQTVNSEPPLRSDGNKCLSSIVMSSHPLKHFEDFWGTSKPCLSLSAEVRIPSSPRPGEDRPAAPHQDTTRDQTGDSRLPGLLSNYPN